MTDVTKKIKWPDILFLELSVVVYSLSTVAGNMASKYPFLSWNYILYFGIDFCILAVYALMWQQVIKKFQLSIAYANKAIGLLWSMLWNFLIFSQGITWGKVLGVRLVMAGVVVMNIGEGRDD